MRKTMFAVLIGLAGCSSTQVATNTPNALVCFFAADAAASAANTAQNVIAVDAVLSTNPACLGLDEASIATIKQFETSAAK